MRDAIVAEFLDDAEELLAVARDIVVPFGILAAVAIPSYQDYTIRAKVSELVLACCFLLDAAEYLAFLGFRDGLSKS